MGSGRRGEQGPVQLGLGLLMVGFNKQTRARKQERGESWENSIKYSNVVMIRAANDSSC